MSRADRLLDLAGFYAAIGTLVMAAAVLVVLLRPVPRHVVTIAPGGKIALRAEAIAGRAP